MSWKTSPTSNPKALPKWRKTAPILVDGLEDGIEDDAEFGEDAVDLYEDDFESEDSAEDSIDSALGQILSAEDEDEFFGKLFAGAKKLIQKAAPVVGKIARGAARSCR